VSLNSAFERVPLSVSRADALKMSRTPARMPITRKGRTGNTDGRMWPNTVWAMSRRMMTPRCRRCADHSLGIGGPVVEKVHHVSHQHDRCDYEQAENDCVFDDDDHQRNVASVHHTEPSSPSALPSMDRTLREHAEECDQHPSAPQGGPVQFQRGRYNERRVTRKAFASTASVLDAMPPDTLDDPTPAPRGTCGL